MREPANRQPAPACSGLADRQGRSHPGVPGACRRQDAAVAAWVDSQDHEVDQRPDDLVEVTSLMLDAARQCAILQSLRPGASAAD